MGWQDLLQKPDERIVLPWLYSQRDLLIGDAGRSWTINGKRPRESGWYEWKIVGRRVEWIEGEPKTALDTDGGTQALGYLVGDRFVRDMGGGYTLTMQALSELPRVHLIPDGVDRFEHMGVREICNNLFCLAPAFPLGPEDEVRTAFLDERTSITDIKGVPPGLDLAFRMESWRRAEIKRLEAKATQKRLEEEAKQAAEERRQALAKQLGDGAGRRELAKVDFATAARAALQLTGAQLLDHRSLGRGQYEVRYRLDGERLACVVDEALNVIDSGICMVDHRSGIKGDTRFTLESLPSAIIEARDDNKLVIFRR